MVSVERRLLMLKRILSFILALIINISVIPVFAKDSTEIVNDNSSVRNMVDNNGICNLKLFLEWLKVHDIKVEKRMVEILESV